MGTDRYKNIRSKIIHLDLAGEGTTSVFDMEQFESTRTLHPDQRHVFFNSFNYGDTKVFTVNGAWVVGSDIVASNGVVHIIDRFLIPVQSRKTMAEYLERPDVPVPKFAFQSIQNASIIDPALKMATNSTASRFTVFAPNDSFFTVMPSYGQDLLFNDTNLLKSAHVIEEGILYIPRLGEIAETAAMAGIVKFDRVGTEIDVTSNKVRARVIQANIPVKNGVIHVIDDLLFYIYRNMKQTIDILKNANFVKASLYNVEDEIRDRFINKSRKMTVFLPTDDALAKLPSDKQLQLDTNATKLSKFFRDHLVMYVERDLDSFQVGETFTTADGEILTMRKVRDIRGSIAHGVILSSSKISDEQDVPTLSGRTITLYNTRQRLYVIGSKIRANVVIEDIWCSNGILHIVDNIVHLPTRTIIDEMSVHPSLSVMTGLMEAFSSLRDELKEVSKHYTMFVPNDDAFTYMPTHRAKTLSETQCLLHNVCT